MKRRILILGLLIALVFGPFGGLSETTTDAPAAAGKSIELTIDFGDGAQKRFPTVPWQPSMSVLDALRWAARHPHGITLKQRGDGRFALVTQIDDLKNGNSQAKNWIFRVNGKLGDKSCAVFSIDAKDRVLWSFEKYQ